MSDTHKRKLVEVALPLDEINAACKADKDRKTGTIRNLHKWFAPAPLPAWRALLFAALVDDPDDEEKRAYLLDVIKRLVANGADLPDEDTLREARKIIQRQFPDGVPTVMDPFCGGGSTLVEAQRLGLPTFGSDLNPVPVLITRTLTELLPKVHGQQPLHPEKVTATRPKNRRRRTGDDVLFGKDEYKTYTGYEGLIRDVTYYAEQIRDKAWEQLKDHYPGQPGETPIAWLWARTATCPNPACGIETILTTSWWLSKKKGDLAWIEPRLKGDHIDLEVVTHRTTDSPPDAPKSGRGASFLCLACSGVLSPDEIRAQSQQGKGLGLRMTAVVVRRNGQRDFRQPTQDDLTAVSGVAPDSSGLVVPLADDPRSMWCVQYGLDTWDKLYTPRQLLTMTTFADLVTGVYEDIVSRGGSKSWAATICTLLGLAVGRQAMTCSQQTFMAFRPNGTPLFIAAFGRNDLPMNWDLAELPFIGGSRGDWMTTVQSSLRSLDYVVGGAKGRAEQSDARAVSQPNSALIATDPPYFDAIGYADLSDFFYLWHRRSLRGIHPDLYATIAAPKTNELTAIPAHHGGSKERARSYFIDGFTRAFVNLQGSIADALPMLVVYASKEQKSGRGEETRWESILSAMLAAGLEITGAWPIHMTNRGRMIGVGTNTVASYIVMVCRPRPTGASTVSLMEFTRELRRDLPGAVLALQEASVLPVDLPQAVLGPGMRIFSGHKAVLDQSGHPIAVGRAMQLISSALGEILDEQQGELDPASRFAVAWWESHGWETGPFGTADQLVRPQGISVDDVVIAGVAESRGGKVHLLGKDDLNRDWQPSKDAHPTAWEAVHHLADRLIDGGGVHDAAELLEKLGPLKDQAQMLAYRLESIAARKGWSKDQERYNALIGSWSDMLAAAARGTGALEGLF